MGRAEDLLVLEDVAGQGRLFVGADPEIEAEGERRLRATLAVISELDSNGAEPPAPRPGRVGESKPYRPDTTTGPPSLRSHPPPE